MCEAVSVRAGAGAGAWVRACECKLGREIEKENVCVCVRRRVRCRASEAELGWERSLVYLDLFRLQLQVVPSSSSQQQGDHRSHHQQQINKGVLNTDQQFWRFPEEKRIFCQRKQNSWRDRPNISYQRFVADNVTSLLCFRLKLPKQFRSSVGFSKKIVLTRSFFSSVKWRFYFHLSCSTSEAQT